MDAALGLLRAVPPALALVLAGERQARARRASDLRVPDVVERVMRDVVILIAQCALLVGLSTIFGFRASVADVLLAARYSRWYAPFPNRWSLNAPRAKSYVASDSPERSVSSGTDACIRNAISYWLIRDRVSGSPSFSACTRLSEKRTWLTAK